MWMNPCCHDSPVSVLTHSTESERRLLEVSFLDTAAPTETGRWESAWGGQGVAVELHSFISLNM